MRKYIDIQGNLYRKDAVIHLSDIRQNDKPYSDMPGVRRHEFDLVLTSGQIIAWYEDYRQDTITDALDRLMERRKALVDALEAT